MDLDCRTLAGKISFGGEIKVIAECWSRTKELVVGRSSLVVGKARTMWGKPPSAVPRLLIAWCEKH